MKFFRRKYSPLPDPADEALAMRISILLWNEDLAGIGYGIKSPKSQFNHLSRIIALALRQIDDPDAFTYELVDILNKYFEEESTYDFDNVNSLATKIYNFGKNYLVSNTFLDFKYACPVCSYLTLEYRNRYLICPVCFWEDEEPGIEEHPDKPGWGPNDELTLNKAKQNFKLFGASNKSRLAFVVPPTPDQIPSAKNEIQNIADRQNKARTRFKTNKK